MSPPGTPNPLLRHKRKDQLAPSMGFQMDALGQDGSDGLHEQDLHDDVFAPVVRSPRVDLTILHNTICTQCTCMQ